MWRMPRCKESWTAAYRPVEISLLLEVAEPTIDDRPDSSAGLRPSRHQAAVAGIRGLWRTRHENHGALGHGVDLDEHQFRRTALDRGCRTHIMRGVLRRRVVFRLVLDRVSRTDDLCRAVLALRRPHGEAGEEASVGEFELAQGIGDVTPGESQQQFVTRIGAQLTWCIPSTPRR